MFNFQATDSVADSVRDYYGMGYIGIRKKCCNFLSHIACGQLFRTSGRQISKEHRPSSAAACPWMCSIARSNRRPARSCKSIHATHGATEFVMQCDIESRRFASQVRPSCNESRSRVRFAGSDVSRSSSHNDKAKHVSGMPDCVRHHSCKISPLDDATATKAVRVTAVGVEPHDATLR